MCGSHPAQSYVWWILVFNQWLGILIIYILKYSDDINTKSMHKTLFKTRIEPELLEWEAVPSRHVLEPVKYVQWKDGFRNFYGWLHRCDFTLRDILKASSSTDLLRKYNQVRLFAHPFLFSWTLHFIFLRNTSAQSIMDAAQAWFYDIVKLVLFSLISKSVHLGIALKLA